MICSRDSAAVAHMSALGSASSSSHGSDSGNGRSNVAPRYPASTLATCLTSPSRLVPVGTSGRRTSYSDSPSSFHTSASRPRCRYRLRSAFRSCPATPGSLAVPTGAWQMRLPGAAPQVAAGHGTVGDMEKEEHGAHLRSPPSTRGPILGSGAGVDADPLVILLASTRQCSLAVAFGCNSPSAARGRASQPSRFPQPDSFAGCGCRPYADEPARGGFRPPADRSQRLLLDVDGSGGRRVREVAVLVARVQAALDDGGPAVECDAIASGDGDWRGMVDFHPPLVAVCGRRQRRHRCGRPCLL